jgi:hypothetical protein
LSIEPNDLDVETDAAGAYEIQRRCQDFVTRNVQFVVSERMQSHSGALRIGVSTLTLWVRSRFVSLTVPGAHPSTFLRWCAGSDDVEIPVVSPEYVATAYRLLGKLDKAALVESWLKEHSQSG